MLLANTGWYVNNFRRSTLLAFAGRGDDVTVVCPKDTGERLLSDLPVQLRTFRLDGTGTNPFLELRSLLAIGRIIKCLKPEVVFTFNPKTNLYGLLVCRLFGVACIPNVSGVGNASQLSGWKGGVYKQLSSVAFRCASQIFFQNEADRDSFDEMGILTGVPHQVLPGSGVDVVRFSPSGLDSLRPFRFLLACRLIGQKGVREYLEAARYLRTKLPPEARPEFWLAGVPDHSSRAVSETEIRAYVERGDVHYLGQVADMSEVMENVDCVVLPSYYPEGVPRFLLEGLAAGKIVVTTDRPGCRDTLMEGINGFFVEPESVGSLVTVLERVQALPASVLDKMSLESRKLAVERFDEKLVIDVYLAAADRFGACRS